MRGLARAVKQAIVKLAYSALTLGILGKIFSRRHFEICFLIFPRKQDSTFLTYCLQWRQFV